MNPYDRYGLCPKCYQYGATSTYRDGAHFECPTSDAAERRQNWLNWMLTPFWGMVSPSKEQREKETRIGNELDAAFGSVPEHIERNCQNCKYKWDEAVLSG